MLVMILVFRTTPEVTVFRLTIRCTFCTRTFTPSIPEDGLPVWTDGYGVLCCDDCYHPECGHGHVTASDRAECETEAYFPETGYFDADPDVEYDRFRDRLIGV